MFFSRVFSGHYKGVESFLVQIEADVTRGLNAFSIVGLGDRAVAEAKDRVASAIKNAGYKSPKHFNHKTVISLSPAQDKKTGTHFDLGIAVAYLSATNQIKLVDKSIMFFGELSLDGAVCQTRGLLALLSCANKVSVEHIFLPYDTDKIFVAIAPKVVFHFVRSLSETIECLKNPQNCLHASNKEIGVNSLSLMSDNKQINEESVELFDSIAGHQSAKRAIEIAVAGGHHCMLSGPPGSGKTLLAQASRFLIPPLSIEQRFVVASIYSTHSIQSSEEITKIINIGTPPFRAPHHNASVASIIGNADGVLGEATLAHHGILFLDELMEFDKRVIEALRIPLEEQIIRLTKSSIRTTLPADFTLISAMNPIANKNLSSKKLSKAIIDRFDIWVDVESVSENHLLRKSSPKNTSDFSFEKTKKRIALARKCQPKDKLNSRLNPKEINKIINDMSVDTKSLCEQIAKNFKFSSRGVHKLIKVSKTIANLDNRQVIEKRDLLEASRFRIKNEDI